MSPQGHPANDTYLMILSYGQWLQWRTTEMAPLTGVQPQAGRRKKGGSTMINLTWQWINGKKMIQNG